MRTIRINTNLYPGWEVARGLACLDPNYQKVDRDENPDVKVVMRSNYYLRPTQRTYYFKEVRFEHESYFRMLARMMNPFNH